MSGAFIPSPLYEFLGRPAPGEPIDWKNIDWDAWKAAEAASKIITYRCGHTGTMPDHVSPAARLSYSYWAAANRDCLPCYSDAQASAAAVQGKAQGLPSLIGSYKQVVWALSIRLGRLKEAETHRDLLTVREQKSLQKRQTVAEAKWWIGTREATFDQFVKAPLPRRTRADDLR